MKIKDYQCTCGHNDFFFADKGNQKGIYCSYCGKWLKWADKDEQNLVMKPVTPKQETGKWIREPIRNEKGGCIGAKMICSKCGNDNKHDEYMDYCPNCGLKMEGVKE